MTEETENRRGGQIHVSTIRRGREHVKGKTVFFDSIIKNIDNKKRRRRGGQEEKKSTTLLVSITCQQEPQPLNRRQRLVVVGHMPPLKNTSTCSGAQMLQLNKPKRKELPQGALTCKFFFLFMDELMFSNYS